MVVVVVVTVMMMVVVAVMVVVTVIVGMWHFATDPQFMATGRQVIKPRPLERILGLEERRVDGKRALEIEGSDAEHGLDRHIGIAGPVQARRAVHAPHAPLDALERGFTDEIGLVEQHHVGERELLGRFVHLLEMLLDVACIDHRDDGVEHELTLEIVIEEEGLRDRPGIGHAGGFDDDVVETVAALEQLTEDAQQIAAHRAADAAVVGLEDLLFGADHELVIDTDLAELVLDDGDTLAVLLREDAVEEGRLSGPEESCQHRDRYAFRGRHDGRMIP